MCVLFSFDSGEDDVITEYEVAVGKCRYHHTAGGEVTHDMDLLHGNDYPLHQLYCIDLKDPRVRLPEIGGCEWAQIRWLPLCFDISSGGQPIWYRIANDEQIEVVSTDRTRISELRKVAPYPACEVELTSAVVFEDWFVDHWFSVVFDAVHQEGDENELAEAIYNAVGARVAPFTSGFCRTYQKCINPDCNGFELIPFAAMNDSSPGIGEFLVSRGRDDDGILPYTALIDGCLGGVVFEICHLCGIIHAFHAST